VQTLFGAVARRYDLLNDLLSFGLHRGWKRRMIRSAGLGPGDQALDVCCGSGDVAFSLAAAGANVVGLDFSEPMLNVARNRLKRPLGPPWAARHTPPTYVRGDALRLPFADESFNAVTISYGLRNLASVEAGLAEMWRVAKPGGRLVVLDFGKPKNPVWRICYAAHLRWVAPLLGWLSGGGFEAYAYILTSLEHYPAQEGVLQAMNRLPLVNVSVTNLLGGAMSIHSAARATTCRRPAEASGPR